MKKTLLLLIIAISPVILKAQRDFGVATGNWAGTTSLYLNPANAADNRAKFVIDLGSVNLGLDNSLGQINAKTAYKSAVKGDSVGINDVFKFGNSNNFSLLAPYAEVRGPGVMFSINHKISLALTTRVRIFNQFDNFNQTLFRTIVDQNFRTTNGNYSIAADKFNWTLHMWSEVGLTYGMVLYDKGKHMLKGGVTLRYLGGIAYSSLYSDHIDATYTESTDDLAITAKNTNLHFASNIISNNNQLQNGIGNLDLVNRFFGSAGGSGIGGDVGLVYEYRPNYEKYRYDMDDKKGIVDYSKNKYKLRVSLAITDIGSINYNNNNFVANFSGNGTVKASQIKDSVKDYNSFVSYAQSHGFNADSGRGATRVHLPTALLLSVDYKIWKRFYVNATLLGNLANRSQVGNSYYGQFTVTPRYDSRVVSVGLPITYSSLSQSMKMGLAFRFSGFFIGTDDGLALLSDGQYGFNVYMGLMVPINKKKIKDRDHDHVSDKMDKCPNDPGTWANHGCPDFDRDKDGVPDSIDKCPDIPGSPTAQGCPDMDKDSVTDADDRCPDVPGPKATLGCPDRDGDGVADIDDLCPDVPGLLIYHGCPDTDGDGIPDNEDKCPKEPGPASNHGCPLLPPPPPKPEVKEEVKKQLKFAATAVQFETGKAVIKATSNKTLDGVVKILNDYPDYIMIIDGHTDNVGKPAANLKLSKDRAEAVKAYFVKAGIAPERLIANGYGDTKPVAANTTAEGRAKNRRVDMDLKLKN